MGQLIDDLGQYLQSNSIGVLGTTLFLGQLPPNPDSAVAVLESTGLQPDIYVPTREPGFQVIVRAVNLNAGRAKADAIRALLQNLYMSSLVPNGTFILRCNLSAEGGHLGRDDNGRDLFSLNFLAETR